MATAIVSVGSRDVLMTEAQRTSAGLNFFPDGLCGVEKSGSDYIFYGGRGNATSGLARVIRCVGTLANPIATSATAIAISGASRDYEAGGCVWKDPNSALQLMAVHCEIWPGGNASLFTTELRLAKSTNGGTSWTNLGVIVTPKDAVTHKDGDGYPIAQRGDYLYTWFEDQLTAAPTDTSLSIARALTSEVIAAANDNTVSTWNKYNAGAWTDLGLGGTSSTLEAGNPGVSWFDVKWNQYTQTLWRVAGDATDSFKMFYQESADGITWTSRTQLNTDAMTYPTLVGTDTDPTVLGQSFYVYYMRMPNGFDWATMEWCRRLVTVSGAARKVAWCR